MTEHTSSPAGTCQVNPVTALACGLHWPRHSLKYLNCSTAPYLFLVVTLVEFFILSGIMVGQSLPKLKEMIIDSQKLSMFDKSRISIWLER